MCKKTFARGISITPDTLQLLVEMPGWLHIVSLYDRPGTAYFANYLEYTYFQPDTPMNELMVFITYRWNGQLWSIISVPEDFKEACEEAAEKARVRMVDGVPTTNLDGVAKVIFTSRPSNTPKELDGLLTFFPLNAPNVFTLENLRNDVMYEGRGGMQDARVAEDYKLEKLWDYYHNREDAE